MTVENERMELKFSEILSTALKGKNISSVAKELGISRSSLHDWASSKRIPSLNNIEQIKRLADYLGLSLEEILIGETNKQTISSISFQDDQRQYQILVQRIK